MPGGKEERWWIDGARPIRHSGSSMVFVPSPALAAIDGLAVRASKGLLLRCCLSALGVILCYQFEWRGLRWFMSEAMLLELRLCGSPAFRVSPDAIQWGQSIFSYDIACTFAEILCGSIAFLWSLSKSIIGNAATIAGYAACLFSLNIVRLAIADLAYWKLGLNWNAVDQISCGICYFMIWFWLFRGAFEKKPVGTAHAWRRQTDFLPRIMLIYADRRQKP
jgi:hypothetical protein